MIASVSSFPFRLSISRSVASTKKKKDPLRSFSGFWASLRAIPPALMWWYRQKYLIDVANSGSLRRILLAFGFGRIFAFAVATFSNMPKILTTDRICRIESNRIVDSQDSGRWSPLHGFAFKVRATFPIVELCGFLFFLFFFEREDLLFFKYFADPRARVARDASNVRARFSRFLGEPHGETFGCRSEPRVPFSRMPNIF